MIRIGGILQLDLLKPGILSGWLVKMAVNAAVMVHSRRPPLNLDIKKPDISEIIPILA
jgi:hypothetical protein